MASNWMLLGGVMMTYLEQPKRARHLVRLLFVHEEWAKAEKLIEKYRALVNSTGEPIF